MKYFTIRLSAPNDRNGNPRRVFVTYTTGTQDWVASYDEGYKGDAAITNRHHRKAYTGITIPVSASTYQSYKRSWK